MILSDSSSPMPGSLISSLFEALLTLIFGSPGDFIAVFGRFWVSSSLYTALTQNGKKGILLLHFPASPTHTHSSKFEPKNDD
jgi:hypothetical protein